MPGSHVILQDDSPSDEDIKEAAEIAAYFSKGKTSGHVPVDYVQVKELRNQMELNLVSLSILVKIQLKQP